MSADMQRATIEILAAVFIWVFGSSWLLDTYADVASWLQTVVVFAGATAIALVIGWWRLGRYGPGVSGQRRPDARVRWKTGLPEPPTSALYLSAAVGGVMSALLLGQGVSDAGARTWGVVFGVLAVVQLGRALRRRGR